jgi:hypothetical protein
VKKGRDGKQNKVYHIKAKKKPVRNATASGGGAGSETDEYEEISDSDIINFNVNNARLLDEKINTTLQIHSTTDIMKKDDRIRLLTEYNFNKIVGNLKNINAKINDEILKDTYGMFNKFIETKVGKLFTDGRANQSIVIKMYLTKVANDNGYVFKKSHIMDDNEICHLTFHNTPPNHNRAQESYHILLNNGEYINIRLDKYNKFKFINLENKIRYRSDKYQIICILLIIKQIFDNMHNELKT